MKSSVKYILSLLLFLSASFSHAYVCDRLDIMGNNGMIQSFMVDDINKMTYLKDSPEADTYTTLHIELVDGSTFDFNMKEIAYVSYQGLSSDWLEIKCESDPHAPIVMLDCINNDHIMSAEKPLDWTADKPNGKPHFDVRNEPGYISEFEIIGQYTGNVYSDVDGFVFWDLAENNLIGVDAWAFHMPNEPIIIRSTATELNTYLGCEFVGKYTGYEFNSSTGLLFRDNIPPLNMELKANGTCHVKTDDQMAYNFVDLYEYREGENGFRHYVEELEEGEEPDVDYRDQPVYGVNGTFLPNDYCVISIHDYNKNQHENTRIYVTGKANFTYIMALADANAYQGLVELRNSDNGEVTHIWMDNYGYIAKAAKLEFLKGTSIGETAEAMIEVDDQTIAKYLLEEGKDPQFIRKGKEEGYYLPYGSETGNVYFDGFGTVTIDGKEYTYVIHSGVATIDYNGTQRVFILDMDAMTFTEQVSNVWDGPEKYVNEQVLGSYAEGPEVAKQKVTLSMDQNLLGKESPGFASLDIQIYGDTKYTSAVADHQRYVYNEEEGTITITTVLAGTGKNGTNRMTFVFQLSADKQRIWLKDTGAGQRIYATTENSYVVLNEANALVAVPVVVPELAASYKASLKGTSAGSEINVVGRILIDQDANGNKKTGYATLLCTTNNNEMISSCVPYTLKSKYLTLKGVTVGDGNGSTKVVDLKFEVTADGRILGNTVIYGATGTTANMTVDLSSGAFLPKAESTGLASKYTGEFYMGTSGYEADVPSITGTLYIGSTPEGTLQPGYACLDLKISGWKFASKSVPYELKDGKLILKDFGVRGTDSSDLVFVINEDGSLQGEGQCYGTGSYTQCYANMSRTKMTPVNE